MLILNLLTSYLMQTNIVFVEMIENRIMLAAIRMYVDYFQCSTNIQNIRNCVSIGSSGVECLIYVLTMSSKANNWIGEQFAEVAVSGIISHPSSVAAFVLNNVKWPCMYVCYLG